MRPHFPLGRDSCGGVCSPSPSLDPSQQANAHLLRNRQNSLVAPSAKQSRPKRDKKWLASLTSAFHLKELSVKYKKRRNCEQICVKRWPACLQSRSFLVVHCWRPYGVFLDPFMTQVSKGGLCASATQNHHSSSLVVSAHVSESKSSRQPKCCESSSDLCLGDVRFLVILVVSFRQNVFGKHNCSTTSKTVYTDSKLGNGPWVGGKTYRAIFFEGGGKRTIECPLQNQLLEASGSGIRLVCASCLSGNDTA